MSTALFIGRVGGIAAALGVGMALLGTGVAVADTDGAHPSSRGSEAGAQRTSSAPAARATTTAPAGTATGKAQRSPATSGRVAAGAAVRSGRADSAPSGVLRSTAPAASLPIPAAATTITLPAPAPSATAAEPLVAIAPDPTATVSTPYGTLGRWMINKSGQVADWVGVPYCGAGSSVGSCTKPPGKTMQEPINTVFVVKAPTKYWAELQLDFALRVSGFGPSCCSSIGYQGIVGPEISPQFPRGGPLGLGILPPFPFGLFQTGLLGLTGLGPAYRDNAFFLANTHLRTFGGVADGNGNYIFTASVSKENLDASGEGLLPTHGFESYQEARATLLHNMIGASWLIGSSNLGLVDMQNQISAANPDYTTADHDGFAQVIALAGLFGGFPAQSVPAPSSARPTRSKAAA